MQRPMQPDAASHASHPTTPSSSLLLGRLSWGPHGYAPIAHVPVAPPPRRPAQPRPPSPDTPDHWPLLEQVLLGRDNAFARAVAQGNLEAGAPVLRAVAYDLDVLQVGRPEAGAGAEVDGRGWQDGAGATRRTQEDRQRRGHTYDEAG